MGVSGVGKTTVATGLAAALGWTFAEGDDFHPEANVAKMAAGVPLTDEDRWPWLRSIGAWMSAETAAGRSAVVTCSAPAALLPRPAARGPARGGLLPPHRRPGPDGPSG